MHTIVFKVWRCIVKDSLSQEIYERDCKAIFVLVKNDFCFSADEFLHLFPEIPISKINELIESARRDAIFDGKLTESI